MKWLFIIVQSILFILYNYLDFSNLNSTYIKYLLVILCFLYALKGKNKYIKVALGLTVVADYFLLVTSFNYEMGIFCFCLVQTIYMLMIGKQSFYKRIMVYMIGLVILFLLKMDYSLQNLLALYSIIFLTFNVIESYKINKILFIGLLLFFLCDISVGLYNMGILEDITVYTMWLFYGPSQVLIVKYGELNEKK